MKKSANLIVLLILISISSMAQQRQITGRILDETGQPVIGASLINKRTNSGTSADANGNFKINAKNGDVLVVSGVGAAAKEVTVGSASTLAITVERQGASLGEVVVTAIGISRAQKTLGYSTATLKSEDLTKARETNVLNSISGKVSGVRVNSQSGTLGGSAKITIRGLNSLGATSPLFVIDGTPTSNNTSPADYATSSNNVDFGNRAGDINPDDVETMTILKGAAATALYGSRAKDGAIIITTKRGKKGANVSVSVNSSVRIDNVIKLPEFQNEYAQGNYGVYNLKYTNGWGPKISEVQDRKFKDFLGDSVTLQAFPDNVKKYFKTGITAMNNVSFAGGGDNSDYRLSFTALNETGVIPKTKLDRYTVSLNSGREFGSKLSSRFAVSYTKTNADGRPAQSSNNSNILTSAIYGLPRVVDIEKLRNNYQDPVTGEQIFLSTDKTGNNPFWIMNYNRNSNSVDRFLGTFTLNYKPLRWLSFTDNLGGDIYYERRASVSRKGTAGNTNGSFINDDIFYRTINNDFLITMEDKNVIEDFGVKLILGHNINERELRSTEVQATDLTIDQLYTYSNASSKVPTLGYDRRRLLGVYGNLGFSYKNIAFLDFTGRNDWSSTLPVKNRSYFYPSVSGSFIFSELTKNISWLSLGKFRASWASVGSDLPPYQLDYQFTPVSSVFLQFVSSSASVFPNSPINTAFTGPRTFPNANLVPQKANSYEFGTDLKFLNNRIGLSASYYHTNTKNQLIPIDVAISTGYFAKYVNVGLISNKGVELDLNIQPIKARTFTWSVDLNFSKNKQLVKSLAPGLTQYSLASGWSGLQILAEPGQAFGLYGTGWLTDSATGEFVLDPNSGLRKTIAKKRFGNTAPDWIGGINNSFSYKGITLSALIDIRKGGVFYSGTVSDLRTSGLAKETLANRGQIFIDKGVIDDGTGKMVPNTVPVQSMQDFWSWYSSTDNTEGNVFDASFVKLREVRLSYSLPTKVLSNSFVKGVEFGLEARNLAIIKSYVPHVDPELSFFGAGDVGEGVEFNSIPSTRSIGLNLRLSF